MGNFNRFNGDRGGRGFGGRGGFSGNRKFSSKGGWGGGRKYSGHGGGHRQMHQATCSKCGADCEVPFKPTGERPVFCSNCFKSQRGPGVRFTPKSFGGGNRGGNVGSNFGGSASVNMGAVITKAQFDSLSVKLDQILATLNAAKIGEASKAQVIEVKMKKESVKKTKTAASAKNGKSKSKKK